MLLLYNIMHVQCAYLDGGVFGTRDKLVIIKLKTQYGISVSTTATENMSSRIIVGITLEVHAFITFVRA